MCGAHYIFRNITLIRYVGVIRFALHVFNFLRLDLQNETWIALANLLESNIGV